MRARRLGPAGGRTRPISLEVGICRPAEAGWPCIVAAASRPLQISGMHRSRRQTTDRAAISSRHSFAVRNVPLIFSMLSIALGTRDLICSSATGRRWHGCRTAAATRTCWHREFMGLAMPCSIPRGTKSCAASLPWRSLSNSTRLTKPSYSGCSLTGKKRQSRKSGAVDCHSRPPMRSAHPSSCYPTTAQGVQALCYSIRPGPGDLMSAASPPTATGRASPHLLSLRKNALPSQRSLAVDGRQPAAYIRNFLCTDGVRHWVFMPVDGIPCCNDPVR